MRHVHLRWHGLVALGLTLCSALCAAALGTDCAPAVAVLRSSAPAGLPRPPYSLRVYMDEKSAPARYEELGLVIANTHVFIPVNFSLDTQLALAAQRLRSGNQRDTAVFRALVRKAARLGADAVIIKSFSKVDVSLTISAVAIRTCGIRPAPSLPPAPCLPPAHWVPGPPPSPDPGQRCGR